MKTKIAGYMLKLCMFSTWLAIRLLIRGLFREAVSLLLSPIGYWRLHPYSYAIDIFNKYRDPSILDVGSPKLLGLFFSTRCNNSVYATDLNDEKIFSRWKRIAESIGISNYIVEFQDARHLRYGDESFDIVYSISVLEHIPGDGDSQALRELGRVLKKGGTLLIEVPYRHMPNELFLNVDSKGTPLTKKEFYERHYDDRLLKERLETADLKIETSVILGEHLPIDPWIATDRLPRLLRIVIQPLEPLLALLNYGEKRGNAQMRPLAALLIYKKDR